MKKAAVIFLKVFSGLVILILAAAFIVPVIFKGRIKTKVEKVINNSVNARVNFGDYRLGFFRNFPNLTFSLDDVSVAGIERFENDTLAAFGSMSLVFDLSSLFKDTGYEVKSIVIKDAGVNAIVLEDGSANWDIAKETGEIPDETGSSSEMKIQLNNLDILNSKIAYIDRSSSIELLLNKMDLNLRGDMTLVETDMELVVKAGEVVFEMEGVKYINKASAEAGINVLANLDSMRFDLRDNYLRINDLALNFAGSVAMPGDDIITDLTFRSEQTSFKSLISLIPAIYLTDFQDLNTTGEFSLYGSAKGVYSDADSTMPDIALDLSVTGGSISYPALPEKISNISMRSAAFVAGKDLDKTTANIESFHMELAGNPFDMSFSLKTPMSDPEISGSMSGRIDLTALSNAVPIDSLGLSGLLNMSLNLAGRVSMIDNEQYDKFSASGNIGISGMRVAMAGYPEVKINSADFSFTPAWASLENASLNLGRNSDFSINGRLANYIPYLFSDGVIKGDLTVNSRLTDMTEIMSQIAVDTTELDDTTSLALIRIPENIDFNMNAFIDEFRYDKIRATRLKGHIVVKDGILSIKETGMDILGGSISMNADYDTRDSLRPSMKADITVGGMGIREAFNTFNTVQKLAPTSKGLSGKVSAKLTYSSLLGSDLMPVIKTISGGGRLQSEEITLVESAVYDRMKETLKLGNNYSNTFRDLSASFKISDGRIIVTPFNTKIGNIRMNIGGDQGIDQTINYVVKTEIPRSDLGSSVNSLIDNLSAQASLFGFSYKPSELIKVNVRISGTFLKPVVTPFFGNAPADSTPSIRETAGATVRQAIDSTISETKDRVRTEAEARAGKIVQEATEQGQKLRDEAARAAAKIRQEADQKGQALVKEAESKGTIAKLAAQKAADSLRKEADRKAEQLIQEADNQANKLVGEANAQKEEILSKIK